jgi:hypothetical protein
MQESDQRQVMRIRASATANAQDAALWRWYSDLMEDQRVAIHTWAKAGETPAVEVTGARFTVNLISAISPRGNYASWALKAASTSRYTAIS